MDAEDRERTQLASLRMLEFLKQRRVVTNSELREAFGHAAMRRAWDLQNGQGADHIAHPITIRKVKGTVWEIRYDLPALARDAATPQDGQRKLPLPGLDSFR